MEQAELVRDDEELRQGQAFDTSLPGRHSYLGDVDDLSRGGSEFHEHGTRLRVPMFYLEGVVLFPERSLPLRVLEARFKAAIERSVDQTKRTIGVTHVREKNDGSGISVYAIGTTAEIRQLRHLPDGSLNVVTKGCQRFRLCRAWTEPDGAPFGEIEILERGKALQVPRDAFGRLASSPYVRGKQTLGSKPPPDETGNFDPEETGLRKWNAILRAWALKEQQWLRRPQRSYWPHWVYRMYDAYDLARRAVDMYTYYVGSPNIDNLRTNPELLSYFLAAELPLSDQSRQELLEIDLVAERLKRAMTILQRMDWIRCKSCRDLIAKPTDVVTMSADGPVATFVNPYGFVYETLTVSRAIRLIPEGEPETECSWFPGYVFHSFCTDLVTLFALDTRGDLFTVPVVCISAGILKLSIRRYNRDSSGE